MGFERRTVLWITATVAALLIAQQPGRLATLLLLPLLIIATVVTTAVLHLALAHYADRTVSHHHNGEATERDPIVPLLSIATPAGLEAIRTKKAWIHSNKSFRIPLHAGSARISLALDRLIATILENHLLNWYTVAISPSDPSFPNAVEATIRHSLLQVFENVVKVDWAKLGVSSLLPKMTHHLEIFTQAQQSMLDSSSSALPKKGDDISNSKLRKKKQSPGANVASEELDLLLANKYADLSEGRGLHPAVSGTGLNTRPSEEKHLRNVMKKVLRKIMPDKEGSSSAVLVMATEIVACMIIRPAVELLSDPDFWNKTIDEKAGAVIREQRMVNKLRQALDANPNIPTTPITPKTSHTGEITVNSSVKDFEAFIKSLSRYNNLIEAKRLRSDIDASLRRARLVSAETNDPSTSTANYIERLGTARDVIDKRIASLGGNNELKSAQANIVNSTIKLYDVLHQPGALAFFMEFMDRRDRSMLAQFYLTIEGLKDPLEEDNNSMWTSTASRANSEMADTMVEEKAAQALRDDVQLLLSTFLLPKAVTVKQTIVDSLKKFYEEASAPQAMPMTKQLYSSTRHQLFLAQLQIYEEMVEIDWPLFQRSNLFDKALPEIKTTSVIPQIVKFGKPSLEDHGRLRQPELILPSGSLNRPSVRGPGPSSAGSRVASGQSAISQRSVSGGSTTSTSGQKGQTFKSSDGLGFLTGLTVPDTASVDRQAERSPLFRDEESGSGLFGAGAPESVSGVEPEDIQQLQTMEAIQDALSTILADDTEHRESPTPQSPASVKSHGSVVDSLPVLNTASRMKLFKRATSPTLKSVPTMGTPDTVASVRTAAHSRTLSYQGGVDDVSSDFEAEDKLTDEEDEQSSAIKFAGPGNLELPAEIMKISNRIDKLKNQEGVLAALLRKAELTGSEDETKILIRSIDALRREISELSFQKRQFETQATENKLLPGRTSVDVIGTTTGQSQGKDFALYLVEVHQLAEDGQTQIAGWLVTRRFSEFVALHAKLKEKLPAIKTLDLPQKRLVTSLSNNLLQQRKLGLAKYLQALVKIPGALASRDVRAFLSQQNISLLQPPEPGNVLPALDLEIFPGQGIIRNVFRTVTTGMDDMFGGPSMLDAIILRLSQQATEFAGSLTPSVQSEDLMSSILGGFAPSSVLRGGSSISSSTAALRDAADKQQQDGEMDVLSSSTDLQAVETEGLTSFTGPIVNFIVEVFDLKDKGSWLRRQAIVIILQQVLGGTIERKVREAISVSTAGDAVLPHVEMFSELLWPGGKPKPASVPRTEEEKEQTREAAFRKLTYLMPDAAASLIGRSNARRGARRMFAVLQNRRLLQHLIYTLLDDILSEVFGSEVLDDRE